MVTGKQLIAGKWIDGGEGVFTSQPNTGTPLTVAVANTADVDAAAIAAEEAFWTYGALSRKARAAFLNTVADEIDKRGAEVTEMGAAETGLPEGRLKGERGRTIGQIRLFAKHILDGAYLDRTHDAAMPDRAPLPRSDLKMVQRPIGPVAVFGASNFPLAFSTAGGDTASALAAGCPVIVKGHPAHPGTSEIVAEAILAAITSHELHPGVFSLIQGDTHEIGGALIAHPLIRAVGFTGSLGAGRALFNACAARPEPIPFFGELGSINPVFLMPEALSKRSKAIGAGWAGSLTMGAGQFCTNPGVVVALAGDDAETFITAAKTTLKDSNPQTMLTDGISNAYRKGRNVVASSATELVRSSCQTRENAPDMYRVSAKTWLETENLAHEVFGPLGIVIIAEDMDEMVEVALALNGQLTCTLQMDDGDIGVAQRLLPIVERKAGRLLVNGFPTGVEVCDAMVHGGPYPASTNFGATSVGTMAMRRFLRPVCYQDFPEAMLPEDLQNVTEYQ